MALSNIRSCLSQPKKIHSLLNLLFIFFLLLFPHAKSISFDFPSFLTNNINPTLQRDAYLDKEGIQLTGSNPFSIGRLLHPEGVRLWDKSTGRLTDFTTHFSFKIKALSSNISQFADGLAFFIAPFNSSMPDDNSRPGLLGLVNGTQNQIVAVEFDTYSNPEYDDPLDCHVGIDVNSLISRNKSSWPTNFTNGSTANAWVTYNSTTQNLSVFLTYAENPVFTGDSSTFYIVDLRTVLPEWVRVGFSATTGFWTESHTILSWSFNSTLEVKDENRKNKLGLVIGLAVSLGVVSGALGLLWFICWRKRAGGNNDEFDKRTGPILRATDNFAEEGTGPILRATDNFAEEGTGPILRATDNFAEEGMLEEGGFDFEDDDDMDDEFEKGTGPKRFTYNELLRATNNFAEGGKLGKGGFGCVYKGLLSESNDKVAVKRISKDSKQGKKEYISEVKIISRLRHKNLVQLIGWCHERELLLVYEYMPNRSLDFHLFQVEISLTWPVRYKIAHGLASALLYLHEECEQYVVHRDIKSSNIMLDSNFNTKLGDFGLARLVEHELSLKSTVMAGTLGYLAPECFTTLKSSKESDVYSFGVVSLEIACGRKPIETQSEPSLVEWVRDLYGKGQLFEAVDKKLGMEFDEGQMKCLMEVGFRCCQPDPTNRPSIKQVLPVLNFEAPFPNLPSKLPVPHGFKFSSTSSRLTSSTNSSMSAGPSKPLQHFGETDVELASIIH